MIPLWVCETCDVLLGMDIAHHEERDFYCVSCATKYSVNEILYIDNNLVKLVKSEFEKVLSENILQFTRYRWLSNRTVGIQFDLDEHEVFDSVDFDFYEFVESDLSDKLDLFITVEFE